MRAPTDNEGWHGPDAGAVLIDARSESIDVRSERQAGAARQTPGSGPPGGLSPEAEFAGSGAGGQAPVPADWCSAGLSVLDAETCYVLPDRPTTELLIYLHGVVPPPMGSPQAEIVQHIVVKAASRAGVAALIPRGIQGIGPGSRRDWWSWPTHETTYQKYGGALIDRLGRSRLALETAVGHRFGRVYLAGSSAGAYFVVLLAAHGEIAVDAYGAMSGGGGLSSPPCKTLPHRPFYIGYGTADSVRGGAEALGRSLRESHWPVRVSAHPFTHGAREIYLDEAFAFWRRTIPSTASKEPQ